MFSWIVDHATTLNWLLALVALGFVVAWYMNRRTKLLACAGVVGGVMGLIFLLTRLVVSDRQQIESNIWGMRKAVLDGKADQLAKHLAKDFQYSGIPGELAAKGIVNVARANGINDIHLWDFDSVELDRGKGQAKTNFKVRVGGGGDTWKLVQAKATFALEGDQWKLREVTFHRIIGQNLQPIDIPLK